MASSQSSPNIRNSNTSFISLEENPSPVLGGDKSASRRAEALYDSPTYILIGTLYSCLGCQDRIKNYSTIQVRLGLIYYPDHSIQRPFHWEKISSPRILGAWQSISSMVPSQMSERTMNKRMYIVSMLYPHCGQWFEIEEDNICLFQRLFAIQDVYHNSQFHHVGSMEAWAHYIWFGFTMDLSTPNNYAFRPPYLSRKEGHYTKTIGFLRFAYIITRRERYFLVGLAVIVYTLCFLLVKKS